MRASLFLLIVSFVLLRATGLSVTSCTSCSNEDQVLDLSRIRSQKRLSGLHSFLDQACAPDEILGRIRTINVKLTYNVSPKSMEVRKTYYDTASGLRVSYTGTHHIKLATWVDFMNGRTHEIDNSTTISLEASGVECIELRYFGWVGEENIHKVYADYLIEVWWFGVPQ